MHTHIIAPRGGAGHNGITKKHTMMTNRLIDNTDLAFIHDWSDTSV